MKKILLLLLCLVSLASATQYVWTQTGGGKWSTIANWLPSTDYPRQVTDSVTLNNTSVAPCTVDVSPSIARVKITSGFSGHFYMSAKVLTTNAGGLIDSGITGVHTFSQRINLNGERDTLLFSGGITTLTSAACTLSFNGKTQTIYAGSKTLTIKRMMIGDSANVITQNSGVTYVACPSHDTAIIVGVAAALTMTSPGIIQTYPNVGDSVFVFKFSGPYTLNGTGSFSTGVTSGVGINIMPKIVYSGTASLTNTYIGTLKLSDSCTWPGPVTTYANSSGANPEKFIVTKYLNCGALTIGAANTAASTNVINNATLKITSFAGQNNASSTIIDSLVNSNIFCSGSWTNGANHTLLTSGMRLSFTGNASATLASVSKSFNIIRDSINSSTGMLTLGDSLTAYSLFCGKGPSNYGGLKTAGYNVNLSASWPDTTLLLGGASPCSTSTSAIHIIGNRPVVKVATSTTLRQMKLSPWSFFHGVHLYLDSNYIFYRMYCPSDTMWIQNGRTPKDSTYTARDWHNLVMRSDVQGSPARINIPAAISDTIWARDIKVQGAAIWDTFAVGTGQNQGGDSNFYFKTVVAPVAIYLTPSYPTAGTLTPATGPAAGGTTVSMTGFQELFAPCSVSFDTSQTWRVVTVTDSTSGTFVSPAGTGVHRLDFKSADNNTLTMVAAWTYVAAPILAFRTSPLSATVGVAITPDTCINTGGAVDSFTISPALPAGLTYSKTSGIISGAASSTSPSTVYTASAYQFGAVAGTATVTIAVTGGGTTPPRRRHGMGLSNGLSYLDEPRGAFRGVSVRRAASAAPQCSFTFSYQLNPT